MMLIINSLTGQTLGKPQPADNPNLGGESIWSRACASSTFNDFYVSFNWTPPLVGSDNEFILELSDANGSFTTPTELTRRSDANAMFTVEFSFALPPETQGESYRFRVRSTSPAATSPPSDTFPMYYLDFVGASFINEVGETGIPGSIQICDGSSITLTPYNITNSDIYQYNWYRSATLLSEKSKELTVSEAGIYFVEIDYGDCTGSANTLSNTIEVNVGTSQGIAINMPTKTTLCSGESVTLSANISGQGFDYTWLKDGTIVNGPTTDASTFTVDASSSGFEGDYQVEISGSDVCVERSNTVTINNADDFTVTLNNPETLVLLPGRSTTLTVNTTANSPQYQWYRNGVLLPGETNNTLTTSNDGSYFARITQTGGACSSTTKDSATTSIKIPTDYAIQVNYGSDYNSCELSSVNLEISEIQAITTDGDRVDVTTEMGSEFTYQWFRDDNLISGETNTILLVADESNNGNFKLTATLDAENYNSNTLPVQLRTSQTVSISTDIAVICEGAPSATISASLDLTGLTFQWFRDNTALPATTNSLTVDTAGNYTLSVEINGCQITSNAIQINDFDDSLSVLDVESPVVIIEGESTTLNAFGADEYQWYDAENNLIGTGASITLTEQGDYSVLATIGLCQVLQNISIEYRDTFLVPNVVTANGDGINDLWTLPNTFSKDDAIRVIIYNEQGEEVLNQTNYQNNWPESSVAFARNNQIFYYKIKNSLETLKQGTITVIR
ncbi:MAG: gliding motility-associated C-terminal domain-containing protein [Bacteroidota bacterium]